MMDRIRFDMRSEVRQRQEPACSPAMARLRQRRFLRRRDREGRLQGHAARLGGQGQISADAAAARRRHDRRRDDDLLAGRQVDPMEENSKGLKVEGELFALNTERGQYIYEGLKAGALDGMSIGYKTSRNSATAPSRASRAAISRARPDGAVDRDVPGQRQGAHRRRQGRARPSTPSRRRWARSTRK
jgi:hypothetical protein